MARRSMPDDSGSSQPIFRIGTMGDKDLAAQQEARDAVEAASLAFQAVADFDQAKIDRICEAMSQVALADAARLGQMAHEETGFGKAGRQTRKEPFRRRRRLELFSRYEDGWRRFGHRRASSRSPSPRGVVAAIIPSDEPNIHNDLQDHHRDQIT